MKLLHIDSSPLNGASASRKLTKAIVGQWEQTHPETTVAYRDLGAQPPAHLDAEILATRGAKPEALSQTQRDEQALTEELLNELFAADVIVIGAPMYNFSVPTQLKAWIDRVAQAGRTFRYTERGPEGLLHGKKVIIASSRGGAYSSPELSRALDFQEDYLKAVLGFLGITDVTIVRAEGLAMGEAERDRAFATAYREIAGLFGEDLAQAA
jgi:FMN-dependent NADH-azoreductase